MSEWKEATRAIAVMVAIVQRKNEVVTRHLGSFNGVWLLQMLRVACAHENVRIVELLLKDERVELDYKCFRSLHGTGNEAIIRLFARDDRATASDWESILCWDSILCSCVRNNCTEAVKGLLEESPVDPSRSSGHLFSYAIGNKNAEIVKTLLFDGRADPETDDRSAIESAVSANNVEIVKLLLADPRCKPMVHLVRRASDEASPNCVEIADLLLDHNCLDQATDKEYMDAAGYSLVRGKSIGIQSLMVQFHPVQKCFVVLHTYRRGRKRGNKIYVREIPHADLPSLREMLQVRVEKALVFASMCKGLFGCLPFPVSMKIDILANAFANDIIVSFNRRSDRYPRCIALLNDMFNH